MRLTPSRSAMVCSVTFGIGPPRPCWRSRGRDRQLGCRRPRRRAPTRQPRSRPDPPARPVRQDGRVGQRTVSDLACEGVTEQLGKYDVHVHGRLRSRSLYRYSTPTICTGQVIGAVTGGTRRCAEPHHGSTQLSFGTDANGPIPKDRTSDGASPAYRRPRRCSAVVDDDAADVLAGEQVVVALVDLIERVRPGDQLVEAERARCGTARASWGCRRSGWSCRTASP